MRTAFKQVAFGQIDDLPGCTQLAIFHSAFVQPFARGGGFGTAAHRARLEEAMKLGYDGAICTVASDNQSQKDILTYYGWQKVWSFNSSKTGHHVELWAKILHD